MLCPQIRWEGIQRVEGAAASLHRCGAADDGAALCDGIQQKTLRAKDPNTDVLHPIHSIAGEDFESVSWVN